MVRLLVVYSGPNLELVSSMPADEALVLVFPATQPWAGESKGRRSLGQPYGANDFILDGRESQWLDVRCRIYCLGKFNVTADCVRELHLPWTFTLGFKQPW